MLVDRFLEYQQTIARPLELYDGKKKVASCGGAIQTKATEESCYAREYC
jgi:hypothetical protein